MLTSISASFTLFMGVVNMKPPYSIAKTVTVFMEDSLPQLHKSTFLIENVLDHKCVAVESSDILLQDCNVLSENMLWKWASRNYLFNIGIKKCLGLDFSNLSEPLGMFECDAALPTLSWSCVNDSLIGANHYHVTVANGKVVAKKLLQSQWRRYLSNEDSFCAKTFQALYALQENGHLGFPCVFPFKYKNKWYHECTNEERQDGLYWCSTTMLYDEDQMWGFCPLSVSGCGWFWETNNITRSCYQFNVDSALLWTEARESCRQQGGDLLSITSLEEWQYLSDRLRDVEKPMWMGLNQPYQDVGWQWSDGSPLTLLNRLEGYTRSGEGKCGAYRAGNNSWHIYLRNIALPYVCKKYTTPSDQETFDQWKYYPTKCEYGWYPYNRYCYKLQREMQTWSDAAITCQHSGSELMSVTSLMEVEVIQKLLENETLNTAWIGMKTDRLHPTYFQWSDDSEVTFTYWKRHEPNLDTIDKELCVKSYRTDGSWIVSPCSVKSVSICKKRGQIKTGDTDEDKCGEDWERFGSSCYRLDDSKRTFQQASGGYYCGSPLAIITNRIEQAFISSLISSKIHTEDKYLWIGLQDQTNSGEYTWISSDDYQQPVTYTNWNEYQPMWHAAQVSMAACSGELSYWTTLHSMSLTGCQRYDNIHIPIGRLSSQCCHSPPCIMPHRGRTGGCVAVRNGQHHGLWEVKDCDTFKAMSLCKKTLSSTVKDQSNSQERNMDSEDICDFWESESHFQYCYKVFHQEKVLKKRTWEEAEKFCQGYGAHLLSFSHLEEEKFVEELLNTMFHPYEKRQFWIGFNKINPSAGGSWQWSDDTPVVSSFLEDMYEGDETMNCALYRVDKKVVPLHCNAKLEWICKMAKGLPPKIPDWHVKEGPWIFFQGNDYLFFNISPSTSESFEFVCAWIGAELLTIHSPAEQNFIHSRIKKLSKEKKKWWIGLQFEDSGTQRWKDGSPLIYTNWENKSHNSGASWDSAHCAYISSDTGLWSYSNCFDLNPAICKTDEKFLIEVDRNKYSNNGSCPTHWLHYEGKCFYVHKREEGDSLDNWFAAEEYCNSHDGNLVSIKNEIEQAFVVMQLFGEKNGFWINLRKIDYDKWENGITKKYSNWSPIKVSHDSLNSSTENQENLCGLISSNDDVHSTGKWYLAKCNTKGYGFVCEKKQGRSTQTFNKTDLYPVDDVMEYGHKTYRVISGNMTWYDAFTTCQKHGAHLASVTDNYHQAFLTIIVNRLGHSHWIGLFSLDHGRHFEWTDHTNSSFTAWKDEGSPSDGTCAYIAIDGHWRTGDCNTELDGAVCLISNNYTTFVDHPADKTKTHHVMIPVAVTSLAVLIIIIFLCYLLKGNKTRCRKNVSLQGMQCTRGEADLGDTEDIILFTELNDEDEK